MEAPELVEVTIDSIRVSLLTQHRVVVLREHGNGRYVPIWIGPFEADAIALAIEGHQPQRPMTHDLALRLLAPLGARMQRVVVNKMAEQTFFAEITLAVGDQIHHVDARPSDAIALAVRTGAPIFVARSVLDTAGLETDTQDDATDPQVEAARIAAAPVQQRPFIEQTWMFLMHLLTGAQGPIDFGKLGDIDLEQSFAVRATEREGRPMVEVRLPGADEAGWLLLQPALWEQFTAMFQEMREAQTKFAQLIVGRAGAAPAGEPVSGDEPAPVEAPTSPQGADPSQGRRRKGKSQSHEG